MIIKLNRKEKEVLLKAVSIGKLDTSLLPRIEKKITKIDITDVVFVLEP